MIAYDMDCGTRTMPTVIPAMTSRDSQPKSNEWGERLASAKGRLYAGMWEILTVATNPLEYGEDA